MCAKVPSARKFSDSKMPFKALLATKHHFLPIPGGHSLHTKSISQEGGPCVRPQGQGQLCFRKPFVCLSKQPLVRHFSVTELHVVLGVNKKIPGFLKLSARQGPFLHSASNRQDGGRELSGSLSWRRKVWTCLYAAFLDLGETSEITHSCRRA